MKKLFISCPMKGRTKENILNSMERMHKFAEAVFDQKLEVIPSYIEQDVPENVNQPVWFLGESIKKMSEADYFIGIDYSYGVFKGCDTEKDIASSYGIPFTVVDINVMLPDAAAIITKELT